MIKRITIPVLLFIGFLQANAFSRDLLQVPCAIQISSTISDGKYTIREITDICRKNNIKAVIFTDRDSMRWQYGFPPLRNIIKKTVEDNSVFRYGVKRYLKEIEVLQEENKDLLLVPAIESAPFYFWKGRPFDKDFKIMNWHKHFLIIGLDGRRDLENLPVTGNIRGLRQPFRLRDILNFWPVILLTAGIFYSRRRKFDYKDSYGRQLSPSSNVNRLIGILFIVSGIIFLVNNYPFCGLKFDQYRQNLGAMPYQNLIDYVNQRKGAIFWAHPEAENIREEGVVKIETKEYTKELLATHDYTGFAIFFEGYKKVGLPGGVWDKLLLEYCQKERNNPIWAIGGLGFDSNGELDAYLKDLRTVVLVDVFNKTEVLKALKAGRTYVVRGRDSPGFVLDKFTVKDGIAGMEKTIGEELKVKAQPVIEIKGHFLKEEALQAQVKVRLVKNGLVIESFEAAAPFDILYEDKSYNNSQGKIYYRVEIESDGLFCIANPVFVE